MQINKEIESLFLRLMKDDNFASSCFSSIGVEEFDYKNYKKIKKEAEKSTKELKKIEIHLHL